MSSVDRGLHRSYLYAPGSRPELMRKALTAGADAVIFDLEDAVAPDQRPAAREAVAMVIDEASAVPADGGQRPDIHVRICREGPGYSRADLQAAVRPGLAALRLPKVESVEGVQQVDRAIGELEAQRGMAPGGIGLYITIESARGSFVSAETLTASPRVVRAVVGNADLLADLGGQGDDDLTTRHVRAQLVVVSRAVGVGPPVDSAFTALDDPAGFEVAARQARALGYFGKSVIHPRQLAAVHHVFTPTDDEIEHAQKVIASLEQAHRDGSGALSVDGEFLDAAMVARARAVLSLWRRS